MLDDDLPLLSAIRRSVGNPGARVTDWRKRALGDGFADAMAGGDGLILHSGTVLTSTGEQAFELVEKLCRFLPLGREPNSWLYWKREALAYDSGALETQSMGLRAPVCFGVEFTEAPSAIIFIEAVSDPQPVWTINTHARAAEALGAFNADRVGMPDLERHPWMAVGRAHSWTAIAAKILDDQEVLEGDPVLSIWLAGPSLRRTSELWKNLDMLTSALAELPKCFCHHDAFKRNLLFCRTAESEAEIVAIDWAFAGYGVIGEEIAAMVGASLMFCEIDPDEVEATIDAVFQGYLRGLETGGWSGSSTDARLGFCATTSMTFGLGALGPWLPLLRDPDLAPVVQSITGASPEAFLNNLANIQRRFLDLGEEALELAGA